MIFGIDLCFNVENNNSSSPHLAYLDVHKLIKK